MTGPVSVFNMKGQIGKDIDLYVNTYGLLFFNYIFNEMFDFKNDRGKEMISTIDCSPSL